MAGCYGSLPRVWVDTMCGCRYTVKKPSETRRGATLQRALWCYNIKPVVGGAHLVVLIKSKLCVVYMLVASESNSQLELVFHKFHLIVVWKYYALFFFLTEETSDLALL